MTGMFNEYPDVMSVKQTAEALGISDKSVYAMLKEGIIGYKKMGSKYLIPKICVEDYIKSARFGIM